MGKGMQCDIDVSETHLALSLRVGYALKHKGELGSLETHLSPTMLNLTVVSSMDFI